MTQPSAAALAPVQVPTPFWWPPLRWLVVLATAGPLLALSVVPRALHLPRYEVSDGQVVVTGVLEHDSWPASTPVEKVTLMLGQKNYGSNIPGYLVGRFDSNWGKVRAYASDSGPGLLFGTRPPTFITPADPDGLLLALKSGQRASFAPVALPLERSLPPLLLCVVLAGLIMLLMLRKPRLTYEIQGDSLIVKTRASTTIFPRQDTAVSLTGDPLGTRLIGTSLPGYYSGTYLSRQGRVQAAATTSRPRQALLLAHAGQFYYLTPTDPAAVAAWFGEGR